MPPLPKRRPPISEPMSVNRIVAAAVVLLILLPERRGRSDHPIRLPVLRDPPEFSAFGGRISPGTGRFGFGPRPGQMTGVRYGLELSGPLSVEGVASWIPTTGTLWTRVAGGVRTVGEGMSSSSQRTSVSS